MLLLCSGMENHRLVLPGHMNHYGFLFGGYLLAWVDEIAWMAANRDYPGCLLVTVGMDEVTFKKSVREGTVLCFRAERIKVGRTSVNYSVRVYREGEEIFSNVVTLVRVDSSGQKLELPTG